MEIILSYDIHINYSLIPKYHKNLKVINITHIDLDGVGCSVPIEAIFDHVDFQTTNYGKVNPVVMKFLSDLRDDIATEEELEERNSWSEEQYKSIPYDLMIISDISPENIGEKGKEGYFNWHEEINTRGHSRNLVILDHHETAEAIDKGHGDYAENEHNFTVDAHSGISATRISYEWCKKYSGNSLAHLNHVIRVIDTYDLFKRDTKEFQHTAKHLDYMFSNWWQKFAGQKVDGKNFTIGEGGKKIKSRQFGGKGFGFTAEQADYIFKDFIKFLNKVGHDSLMKENQLSDEEALNSDEKTLDWSIDPTASELNGQFDAGLAQALTDIKRDFVFMWENGIYVLVHGDNGSFINHICDYLLHDGILFKDGTRKTFDFVITGKTGPFSAQFTHGIKPGEFGPWGSEPHFIMTSGSCRSNGNVPVNKTVEAVKHKLNRYYEANGGLPTHTHVAADADPTAMNGTLSVDLREFNLAIHKAHDVETLKSLAGNIPGVIKHYNEVLGFIIDRKSNMSHVGGGKKFGKSLATYIELLREKPLDETTQSFVRIYDSINKWWQHLNQRASAQIDSDYKVSDDGKFKAGMRQRIDYSVMKQFQNQNDVGLALLPSMASKNPTIFEPLVAQLRELFKLTSKVAHGDVLSLEYLSPKQEVRTVLTAGGGGHEKAGGWSCIIDLEKFPKTTWGTYMEKQVPSLSPVAVGYIEQVAKLGEFGKLLYMNKSNITYPENIVDLDSYDGSNPQGQETVTESYNWDYLL